MVLFIKLTGFSVSFFEGEKLTGFSLWVIQTI